MRENSDKVAVVVLNYNSFADCKKCVSYLKRQEDVSLDIVLVDNCSKDNDRKQVKQLAKDEDCTFIAASENRGYNAGNNIGLRYSASRGYKYAMVANPDMEFPQPRYISTLVAKMEEDSQIAVLGSDIVTIDGIHQNPRNYEAKSWIHSFDWLAEVVNKKQTHKVPAWISSPDKTRYCNGLNGCCFLIRMSFATSIGFFDENTFLYGEEPILSRQVEMNGLKMYYLSNVKAIHDHKKSKEGNSSFCSRHWKHSRQHYVRCYSGYPIYGKWFALISNHLYFLLLNLRHKTR